MKAPHKRSTREGGLHLAREGISRPNKNQHHLSRNCWQVTLVKRISDRPDLVYHINTCEGEVEVMREVFLSKCCGQELWAGRQEYQRGISEGISSACILWLSSSSTSRLHGVDVRKTHKFISAEVRRFDSSSCCRNDCIYQLGTSFCSATTYKIWHASSGEQSTVVSAAHDCTSNK